MAFGIGESVGTAYVRIVADGRGLDRSIKSEVEDAIDHAHLEETGGKAGRDFTDGMDKEFEKRLGKGPGVEKGLKNLEVSIQRQLKLQRYFDSPNWRAFVKQAEAKFGDVGFIGAKSIEKEFIEQSKSLDLIGREQEGFVARIQDLRRKIEVEREKQGTALGRFARDADAFGNRLAAAFGGGSRNNFLNIFGKFVAVVPEVAARVAGFMDKVGPAVSDAGKAFTEAGGGLKGFQDAASLLTSRGLPALAGGLPVAASALIGVGFAASTVSLALGGLSAAIGTLGTGLIGGVGLLAAAMVPLAASIGAVATAYISMSDAQKEAFSSGLQPLKDAFGGLGDIAADTIFTGLGEQLSSLAPIVDSLQSSVHGVSSAVRANIDSWIALANSGAFSKFFRIIGRDLPEQIGAMNRAVQNLVTTFTGFFNAVSPVLSEFLNDLGKVTGKFSDWANSAKGQSAIRNFFETALDSIEAIGSALVSAGRLLGNFFRIGAESGGNDLFRSLADTFNSWNQSLLENEGSVSSWMRQGSDFLKLLGDIVVKATQLVEALDTPAGRLGVFSVLEAGSGTLTGVTTGLNLAEQASSGFNYTLQAGASIWNHFTNKSEEGTEATEKTSDAWARGAEDADSYNETITAINRSNAQYARQQTRVADAAKKTSGAFLDLANSTDDAKLSAQQWIKQMNQQARALSNFADNLRTVAERGLRQGLIKQLEEMGPAGARALQQLADGSDKQIGAANRAWGRGKQAAKDLQDAYGDAARIINGTKIKPDVDTGEAENNVDRLSGKLDGLHDKTVTVTVTAVARGNADALNKFGGNALAQASGGIVNGPTMSLVGEAGPEAIVPLRRPLGMVDPSVRALSAIAQGIGGAQKVFNVGPITVNTPTTDPRSVAVETVNRLAAVGGF